MMLGVEEPGRNGQTQKPGAGSRETTPHMTANVGGSPGQAEAAESEVEGGEG